jgi:hypothetical protein
MMTLIQEMRLFLRQICGAIGMSGTAAHVVPVVVLGVVFNAAALSLVANMRSEKGPACQETKLRDAAQTELKVMRTAYASPANGFPGCSESRQMPPTEPLSCARLH